MNLTIKDKYKKIKIRNVKKLSEFEKGIGLMFKKREKCPAMLFEFASLTNMKIHSFFVFFSFGAVWLDDKNKILDKKIVKPFKLSVSCKKPFYKLIEIPINKKYKKEFEVLFNK